MSNRLRSIFMGTPEFALPALRALQAHTELALVVTQPDRKKGRGKKMLPPPVKSEAMCLGVEVIQPVVTKGKRFTELLASYHPDVIVTAAFGRILGPSLLAMPRYGCINVHASLLPKHRGAAPINKAILDGDEQAGVSIMKTVSELDAGPVYKTASVEVGAEERAGELTGRLAELGARSLIEVLKDIENFKPHEQVHALSTYAPMMHKADGILDWTLDCETLSRRVRAFHPWPCAFTSWNGASVKIHRVRPLHEQVELVPGTVIQAKKSLRVACREGQLDILEIQMPGKKMLSVSQFLAGGGFPDGTVFSITS